jgi:hypothetical protein
VLLAVRIAWFALPLTAGPALADALSDASTPVQVVASILAWAAWGGIAVAVLVPRTVSLTALRIGAPAARGGAGGWGGRARRRGPAVVSTVRAGDIGPAEIVAIAWTALLAALVLFVPVVTDVFVDGSSYGPELRMALRTPAPLFLGPVELAWLVVVAGIVAGPLLLAAKAWALGAIAIAIAAVAVRPAARSLHQLSRRWLVFVRNGFVLHDPLTLADPVLFPKQEVRSLGPAPADAEGDATDLTGRALGLALELRLAEAIKIGVIEGRGRSASIDTDRLLFTPARPGALLSEARERGIV